MILLILSSIRTTIGDWGNMEIKAFIYLCILDLIVKWSIDANIENCHPEQVHLAYGDTLTEMVVVWSTKEKCISELHYRIGSSGSFSIVQGTSQIMSECVKESSNLDKCSHLNRAKIMNLVPNSTYFYMPKSNNVSNGPFYFRSPPQGENWQPQFLVLGDLEVQSESFDVLLDEALSGEYSAILAVGNFGNDTYQTIMDESYPGQNVGVFMQQIERISAYVPYMVAPGNRENEGDKLCQYCYRFSMPNTNWPIPLNQMWYSLNIGPVHFLSYSTEVYFLLDGKYVDNQKHWIEADLNAANANRNSQPWIIAFGHQPMYCSNGDDNDCAQENSKVRQGLEDIFYDYGVDIVIQVHEQCYERLWPMYKGVVVANNYTNPRTPIQLISSTSGRKLGVDDMHSVNASWSAFRLDNNSANSFGRLTVYNNTHVYWEQVALLGGELLDSVWITQTSHGKFSKAGLPKDQKDQIEKQIKVEQMKQPKPETTGDLLKDKVSNALNGADVKVIIGVSFGVFVVFFLLIVCIVKTCCRKRSKSFRRWDNLDYGKKFYTNVKSDDKDTDDFEVEVSDGTTKLIGNGKD